MPRRHITQDEAHELARKVNELQGVLDKQRSEWTKDWPGAIHIGTIDVSPIEHARIATARRLKHAVVVTLASGNQTAVEIYASAIPEVQ